MPNTGVVVVGAGAAGLMAARELRRAGQDVLVLEASSRTGGRILTLHRPGAGVPIELGAEFVHGDAPETTKLIDEARLATVPVTGEQYRSDRGELSSQSDIWKRMRKVFRHLDPDRRKDRSFAEFLDERPGGRKLRRERELARGFVQGFSAADISLVSEKSIAAQGDPTEGAAQARRIVPGYSALVAHLEQELEAVVRLNTPVARIAHYDSGVRVWDAAGAEYEARAIILAVPLPVLQDTSFVIEPELATVRKAAGQLVMGHVVRVSVIVSERFWEDKVDELSYVHSPDRAFNVWWTQHPLRAMLLTGWSGGPPALAMTRKGNAEDVAIREMGRVFGVRRARIEALVQTIDRYDWTSDPNIRGAYSYAGVGGAHAARTLARPASATVFLAGEATDSGKSGSVEGALASGKRAARQALKSLDPTSSARPS